MGGALPEQPDTAVFERVLDVGCGIGGWLIEMAKTRPSCKRLVGVDSSKTLIESARKQAEAAGVSDRVQFQVADALAVLEFPTASFDLVNQRFAWSWLRTWDWRKLLQEFQRVARPGGVVRLTEGNAWKVDSPVMTRLANSFLQAMYQSGHSFKPEAEGINDELANLLRRYGVLQVQTKTYDLQITREAAEGLGFFENIRIAYQTGQQFMRKWTRLPEDYEEQVQQAVRILQRPGTVATWQLLTAWGTAPEQEPGYVDMAR